MALVRYRPNRRGLKALLGAEFVRLDLVERAERIAEHVRLDYAAKPPHSGEVEVTVDSEAGETTSKRARAAVIAKHPGVVHIEHDRRPLGSAVDAAKF